MHRVFATTQPQRHHHLHVAVVVTLSWHGARYLGVTLSHPISSDSQDEQSTFTRDKQSVNYSGNEVWEPGRIKYGGVWQELYIMHAESLSLQWVTQGVSNAMLHLKGLQGVTQLLGDESGSGTRIRTGRCLPLRRCSSGTCNHPW
jgi:hypothetical protein